MGYNTGTMSYSTNPYLPRVRRDAVRLVRKGWSTRQVCRYLGVGSGTVSKWVRRDLSSGHDLILTKSSRPKYHPRALAPDVVEAIVQLRLERRRCAEVIHAQLKRQGVNVSLSSVKRTLDRRHLTKHRSPWQRYHPPTTRPLAEKPGDLVEIDTIHVVPRREPRFYIYTLIDVYSRWAWAKVTTRINTHRSLRFVHEAQSQAPFSFSTIQSDHGSEFSTWFTEHVGRTGLTHRHSRIRQPNDNGHLERFNRTIQEECRFPRLHQTTAAHQRAIDLYLPYYNSERLHLGLKLKTPLECVQGVD